MKNKTEILLLVLVMVVAGYILAPDYGVSWDEPDNAAYGNQALTTYLTLKPPDEWQSNLESKGPFFMAAAEALSLTMTRVLGDWSQPEARHFIYFLSYVMAAVAIYYLAGLVSGRFGAFAATLLFVAQPLFFGHAFINPKDIPFMAFFLLTMSLGVHLIRKLDSHSLPPWNLAALAALAGLSLGLTMSIRLFGAFAGALVTLWGFIRLKRSFVGMAIAIWSIASLAMYASWPYLWGQPIRRFIESLQIMLDFPWDNLVLYRGLLYPVEKLPWHYLPFITITQLTETLLLLAAIGGLITLLAFVRQPRHEQNSIYLIIFLWIALPYGFSILTRATVYDNSRQFLFALPPLALFASKAFQEINSRFRQRWVPAGLLFLALLQGIWGSFKLHPYEYIYYNSLVGGVRGAFRSYEMDYWATSYREAMEYINETAPAGAAVEVFGPWQSASIFARPDLNVSKSTVEPAKVKDTATYFILSTRGNADQDKLPDAGVLTEVKAAGAVLSVVKEGPN